MIPSLSFSSSSSAKSSLDQSGAAFSGSGGGNWTVNEGTAAPSGIAPWMLIAALGVAWLIFKK
jgi:hypothetical protein